MKRQDKYRLRAKRKVVANSKSACVVCYDVFDLEEHVPHVLPCGHSVCAVCVPGLNGVCPQDRSTFKAAPKNYLAIELLAQITTASDYEVEHRELIFTLHNALNVQANELHALGKTFEALVLLDRVLFLIESESKIDSESDVSLPASKRSGGPGQVKHEQGTLASHAWALAKAGYCCQDLGFSTFAETLLTQASALYRRCIPIYVAHNTNSSFSNKVHKGITLAELHLMVLKLANKTVSKEDGECALFEADHGLSGYQDVQSKEVQLEFLRASLDIYSGKFVQAVATLNSVIRQHVHHPQMHFSPMMIACTWLKVEALLAIGRGFTANLWIDAATTYAKVRTSPDTQAKPLFLMAQMCLTFGKNEEAQLLIDRSLAAHDWCLTAIKHKPFASAEFRKIQQQIDPGDASEASWLRTARVLQANCQLQGPPIGELLNEEDVVSWSIFCNMVVLTQK